MTKLAFLGLGRMGTGMAGRLVAAGHDVAVWNRSSDKMAPLVAAGARAAISPRQAAEGARAVFAMVADDDASNRCWMGPDGALQSVGPGTFVIECSTVSYDQCLRLDQAARARGARYIDCPVNGPPAAAASGDLILLVGADAEDLAQARPWLALLSSTILHFGPVGTGTAYKLINNLLGAVHVAAIAEAANLARTLGLDADTMVAAIESGPVGSPHTKRMIRPMMEGRRSDQLGLAIALREKDARYCLKMASAQGLGMSVGERAHDWYTAASEHLGPCDDSALLDLVEKSQGRAPAPSVEGVPDDE